jgi:signal transduction histidine kinase
MTIVAMMRSALKRGSTAPERALRSLVLGSLVFRWVWLVWMCGVAFSSRGDLRYEALAWLSLALAAVWTVILTLRRHDIGWAELLIDLAVCGWLVGISGIVVHEGEVISGRPFFAIGYPTSAPLLWGAFGGARLGVVAGGILCVLHLLSRPLNGVPLDSLSGEQWQNVAGAMLNYLVAGIAVGFVSRLLESSAEAVRQANEDLVVEREHAARLSERASLAREIHDSVLQALSLVHKRSRELAARDTVPGSEVAGLSTLAGEQEQALRTLILRDPAPSPSGTVSLRDELEAVGRDVAGLEVSVVVVGSIVLAAATAKQIAAAVRQALENVVRHSGVSRASVFAEAAAGSVEVVVRDTGRGFVYDEDVFEANGKFGILKSMKGRVQELGGTMRLKSDPGRGTEVEFLVPLEAGPA